MTETKSKKEVRGAAFLVDRNDSQSVCTPEDFSEEQRSIGEAVADFMKQEVTPKVAALEEHDYELLTGLIRQAGELGLLGVDLPEEFGGLGQDLTTSALVLEAIGGCGSGSYATAVGAHSGIGTWPILYFGNEEQKRRFLPGIVSGGLIAAYALTESSSGSDALAAKCKAVLSPDGKHYVVNGEKVFITNAKIADIFTVFVKIDGDNAKMACLVIEKGTPGLSIDREEHKMGIRGSSTCRLVFEDALVPAENLLGTIGKGHKIVLNTLNLGRFKLGAGAVGAIKSSVNSAVQYASERKQFGKPLLDFDGIRAKIADMVVAGWVGESMVFRTAGLLSSRLHGAKTPEEATKAIEEYTVECSLVKVGLSEMLGNVADEMVQVYGGYGYVEEYPASRMYRDSRINRIFEGTNEINRMLAVGEVLKRHLQGRIDLVGAAKGQAAAAVKRGRKSTLAKGLATAKQLRSFAEFAVRRAADQLPFSVTRTRQVIEPGPKALRPAFDAVRSAVLYALGEAMMTLQAKLKDEQQLLFALADLLLAVFAMESALLRYEKLAAAGADAKLAEAVVRAYFCHAQREAADKCVRVLSALSSGLERQNKVARVLDLLAAAPLDDLVALKRRIGDAAAEQGKYPF
ncbi:MAG: acyl-CoA dehydrogenase family protein [Patescibacteria group bacterium]|jgi:alkylation response protein AidB-like acyl-CoA dehydrogenase